MADTAAAATVGQPGHPNLKAGAEGWKAGQSGNPTGVNKYLAQLRAAIQEQETPEEVCKVVAAMREDAKSGKKSAPAAAKVYLGAVGLKLDGGEATKIDLSDAPPETMEYLRRKIPN